jgi:hypothetical protein
MHVEHSTTRKERARHRHDLHTLTYVVIDQANGGIVRNLSHEGIAVQAVAAVRAGQNLRLRFELPQPRLRIETRGEVMWSTHTGQCGIRFIDLPPHMRRRVDQWIFGSLLEGIAPHSTRAASTTAARFPRSATVTGPLWRAAVEDDGLILSPAPVKVIELPSAPKAGQAGPKPADLDAAQNVASAVAASLTAPSGVVASASKSVELDWLSQPLSSRGIAWSINVLAVLAALLLFALVFLSVTRESPRWPAAMVAGAAIFVASFYWGFFKLFGGVSPGTRLARLAGYDDDGSKEELERR